MNNNTATPTVGAFSLKQTNPKAETICGSFGITTEREAEISAAIKEIVENSDAKNFSEDIERLSKLALSPLELAVICYEGGLSRDRYQNEESSGMASLFAALAGASAEEEDDDTDL